QPFQANGQARAARSWIGVKKPTKVKPVHTAKTNHRKCLAPLRSTFSRVHGPASSFIRLLRSPSVQRSIHRNTSVQTVCGQAKPHHRRPASAVTKNSVSARMISSSARKLKSCGQKV